MTKDLKDLVPAQEKLEWVTPKISLMDAEDTLSKCLHINEAKVNGNYYGPSGLSCA